MRQLILTNDDGVDAPGLAALHQCLTEFLVARGQIGDWSITVIAPDRGRSECSHSVTTGRDLTLVEVRPNWFSLDGTPVDCVRVALSVLQPDAAAVLSGINAGANVGVDLLVSGTFAAAREAAVQGRPAIAVSHYRKPDVERTWEHTPRWLAPVLDSFWAQIDSAASQDRDVSQPGVAPLWNVNLPAIDPTHPGPEVVDCHVDPRPMVRHGVLETWAVSSSISPPASTDPAPDAGTRRVQLRSDFHGRPRDPGSDIDACFGGKISRSRVRPHLT